MTESIPSNPHHQYELIVYSSEDMPILCARGDDKTTLENQALIACNEASSSTYAVMTCLHSGDEVFHCKKQGC